MSSWKRYNGGRGWRFTAVGYIEVEGGEVPRTRGEPSTMHAFLDAHRITLEHYSERFGIPIAEVMGIAGVECAAYKERRLVGESGVARSPHIMLGKTRYESHIPDHSNSPWQILTGTASDRNRQHELVDGGRRIHTDDLAMPEIACGLSVAHMRHLYDGDRTPDAADYVHLQAAWNAGRVKPKKVTGARPWGFKTYGPERTLNAIKWHNDALAVLIERGMK